MTNEALAALGVIAAIICGLMIVLRTAGGGRNQAIADRAALSAHTLFVQGRLDDADTLFDRALARVPDHPGAWVGKARILLRRRQISQALAATERALPTSTVPMIPHLIRLRGLLLWMLGRYDEALAEFERSLARDPSDALAWRFRISCLWCLGRAEEALSVAKYATSRLSGAPIVWAQLAELLLRFGLHAQALTASDRAQSLLSADASPLLRVDVLHIRAVALTSLGHQVEALAAIDEAMTLAPTSGLIVSIRARVRAALRRTDDAQADAARALDLLDRQAKERATQDPWQTNDPIVAATEAAARRDALRVLGRHAEAETFAEQARAVGW
jgi:tetratricopeptide (TPR) repeat protein